MSQPERSLVETLSHLATEARDPALADIDRLSMLDRCRLQNRLDQQVALAVEPELPLIAYTAQRIAGALRAGGRLIYLGAGTSGRLGVLDASECPPTFGTLPSQVQGIIAGGDTALRTAVEGAEDNPELGASDVAAAAVMSNDVVVGITASGRTPYVLGALAEARRRGALTVGVTNNRPSEIESVADAVIAIVVGPELIAGSTRLKAGTAQKLVLNMLTTQAMIELGKTYGNAMVDVMATNAKLKLRALKLVTEITGISEPEGLATLEAANGSVKVAIAMLKRGLTAEEATGALNASGGRLRDVLDAD
jgi:N-acetylmuramic acid 6-phosphate etherase